MEEEHFLFLFSGMCASLVEPGCVCMKSESCGGDLMWLLARVKTKEAVVKSTAVMEETRVSLNGWHLLLLCLVMLP